MKNIKKVLVVMIIGLFSFNGFAQSDVTGNWVVGEQNTVVKMEQERSIYSGKIISSDNPKAEIGEPMVKDLIQGKKGKWEGQVYSPKRKEWYDAEFKVKGNTLEISISVGFFSKTMKWVRVK
jgi:uncharacterized protein (DUF2147 family)